ncbi:MAG: hypothetical protein HDT14_04045 [Oscillibacter sp.]|nr:hypothetical protein [Oscillibacter sp.]
MKRSTIKAIALCLCGTLAAGCAGVRALASGSEMAEPVKPVQLGAAAPVQAPCPTGKDETVYVLTKADGSVEKIIVSDWLKNADGSASLADSANLDGVENVKGSESFTLSGGTRVWDAQGNDIYTQGTTDQALPVDMTVSYTLDGKTISPEELAGKSGRVTIRFDYANREYQMMDVGGKQEKIYVPFAMLTGMALDNEIFHNVAVSTGKIYNDGDRTAVIGMAFPGLQENLDVDPEKLEIPDYVEITADVTGFELGITLTVAVSDLFGQLDTDQLDSTDDLNKSLDKLTDAMDQLTDGSNKLYDGLCTLLDKSAELADGVDKLAAGAEALKAGVDSLETGAVRLQEGTEALSIGLETLNGNSETLNAGAKQVFNTLLASASQQLTGAGVTLPAELTAENYGTILDGVIAALPEAASGSVVQLKASLDSYNQFYQGLQNYTAGVAQAAAGAGSLMTGASQLTGGASQVSGGAAELYGGVMTLKNSTPALVDGVKQLRDGSRELADGLDEFNRDGVQKLVDAVDGNLEGFVERLKATADASRGYRSFSGIDSETEGQVKFIYRTAPVEIKE